MFSFKTVVTVIMSAVLSTGVTALAAQPEVQAQVQNVAHLAVIQAEQTGAKIQTSLAANAQVESNAEALPAPAVTVTKADVAAQTSGSDQANSDAKVVVNSDTNASANDQATANTTADVNLTASVDPQAVIDTVNQTVNDVRTTVDQTNVSADATVAASANTNSESTNLTTNAGATATAQTNTASLFNTDLLNGLTLTGQNLLNISLGH